MKGRRAARFASTTAPRRGEGGGDAINAPLREEERTEKRSKAKSAAEFRLGHLLTQLSSLILFSPKRPREERTARDTISKPIMHDSRRLVSISIRTIMNCQPPFPCTTRCFSPYPPSAKQFMNLVSSLLSYLFPS